MFVTRSRLRAKIDSLNQMEIRTSKGDILETTMSFLEYTLTQTFLLMNMLNIYVRNLQSV